MEYTVKLILGFTCIFFSISLLSIILLIFYTEEKDYKYECKVIIKNINKVDIPDDYYILADINFIHNKSFSYYGTVLIPDVNHKIGDTIPISYNFNYQTNTFDSIKCTENINNNANKLFYFIIIILFFLGLFIILY